MKIDLADIPQGKTVNDYPKDTIFVWRDEFPKYDPVTQQKIYPGEKGYENAKFAYEILAEQKAKEKAEKAKSRKNMGRKFQKPQKKAAGGNLTACGFCIGFYGKCLPGALRLGRSASLLVGACVGTKFECGGGNHFTGLPAL